MPLPGGPTNSLLFLSFSLGFPGRGAVWYRGRPWALPDGRRAHRRVPKRKPNLHQIRVRFARLWASSTAPCVPLTSGSFGAPISVGLLIGERMLHEFMEGHDRLANVFALDFGSVRRGEIGSRICTRGWGRLTRRIRKPNLHQIWGPLGAANSEAKSAPVWGAVRRD